MTVRKPLISQENSPISGKKEPHLESLQDGQDEINQKASDRHNRINLAPQFETQKDDPLLEPTRR